MRGWAARELVEVRPSTHGLGLFARQDLVRGMFVGEYPGVRRRAAEAWEKCQRFPNALQYVFQCDDGSYYDPTDGAPPIPPASAPTPRQIQGRCSLCCVRRQGTGSCG